MVESYTSDSQPEKTESTGQLTKDKFCFGHDGGTHIFYIVWITINSLYNIYDIILFRIRSMLQTTTPTTHHKFQVIKYLNVIKLGAKKLLHMSLI